jgi:hypothetical protein
MLMFRPPDWLNRSNGHNREKLWVAEPTQPAADS